jgi:hypothetical protein
MNDYEIAPGSGLALCFRGNFFVQCVPPAVSGWADKPCTVSDLEMGVGSVADSDVAIGLP